MSFIGNLLWLLFGGLLSAIGYFAGGLALCMTIVGIPFGLQCFKLGLFVLWPFGSRIIGSPSGDGCLTVLLNILWIICGGLYAAVVHLAFGALLCLTVIGIPFGMQHFKLAGLALAPFGKRIVQG